MNRVYLSVLRLAMGVGCRLDDRYMDIFFLSLIRSNPVQYQDGHTIINCDLLKMLVNNIWKLFFRKRKWKKVMKSNTWLSHQTTKKHQKISLSKLMNDDSSLWIAEKR